MKKGKEVFKDLYNFEGFSFREICKENSVLIQLKKKGKTGICPVCNKKRRKVIEIRQRKIIVEPAIGDIKENYGFRQFSVRGLNGAKLELNLISIAHNLKKIWILGGKISQNNNREIKNINFCLITEENYLNCTTQPALSKTDSF